MGTPEDKKKSRRRPVPTSYDEDEHALHVKVGEGRGRPFKVLLDDIVPKAPKAPSRTILIKHSAPAAPAATAKKPWLTWASVGTFVFAIFIGMCHGAGSHMFEKLLKWWG